MENRPSILAEFREHPLSTTQKVAGSIPVPETLFAQSQQPEFGDEVEAQATLKWHPEFLKCSTS